MTEQKELEDRIVERLRVEMMALHLGDDLLISEEEAAHLLGCHPKTLYKLRVAGELPYGMLGSKPRYSLGNIRRFMRDMVLRNL